MGPAALSRLLSADRAHFHELDISFDRELRAIFASHRAEKRMCFTPGLLADVRSLQEAIRGACAHVTAPQEMPFNYLVWCSQHDGIYNVGGDLELISSFIHERNRDGLTRYAVACVDACYFNAINVGLPYVSVALVQGETLGGGFESALSNDIIVAERRSRFGLPEILFGLFPGMGAYSFLGRRIGAKQAERMILSGKVYSAEELYGLGVVDVIAEDGSGKAALKAHLSSLDRHFAAHRAIFQVRRRFAPLTRDEMIDIAQVWVDTALQLDEHDLKRMRRLASAQERRRNPKATAVTNQTQGLVS